MTRSYSPRGDAADFSETPKSLPGELRRTVLAMAEGIGERNLYRDSSLERAAEWIERELRKTGLHPVRDSFTVVPQKGFNLPEGKVAHNIIAEIRGTGHPEEVLVIGAHYDTKVATPGWHVHVPAIPGQRGTPGANDNASGVACTLALAKMFAGRKLDRTVRFCFWANEEPPFYQTEGKDSSMGSYVYALRHHGHEKIIGMISPETMGCFSHQPLSKRHKYSPLPDIAGLPARPDYIAFQSNIPSGPFARECAEVFSHHARVPVRASALITPFKRAAWSDDWSFWQFGVRAFAVTDTAYFRSDHYHETSDTPDKLDYGPFADVVWGLKAVVSAVAGRQIAR